MNQVTNTFCFELERIRKALREGATWQMASPQCDPDWAQFRHLGNFKAIS